LATSTRPVVGASTSFHTETVMKKNTKLTLQRNAIRILDRKELVQPAGAMKRNPFDDTIHSHWAPCDSHFDSSCFAC
jgi:hypothetical protein